MDYCCFLYNNASSATVTRIQRIQNRAARFIKQDYRTKVPGCVTAMLQDLHLPGLQDWRRQLRLAFMYKVVEGKVPAMTSSEFFSPRPQSKRKIRTRTYADCVTTNVVERSAHTNSRAYNTRQ